MKIQPNKVYYVTFDRRPKSLPQKYGTTKLFVMLILFFVLGLVAIF